MKHRFELRSVESSDLIGTYPDQDSALQVIRAEFQQHGGARLQSVALARYTLRGIYPIAVGQDLIDLAMLEPSAARPVRRRERRRAGGRVAAVRGRVARRSKVIV